ncbi:FadR family transcriptional regulator [Kibdelosporangium aridum]|uniref:FadR family transcriptional regulator n=2 Tax=Kibdelosporangium aridum TaxID=2030 RepID=A0A428Z6G9_KIBAR|nr:FadR family transcriptional regulator [Kibdelosporangium aridum]
MFDARLRRERWTLRTSASDGPSLRLSLDLAPAGPMKVKSAAEQLVDRLITAIALGALLPGQKLPPEREFAARLNVSRTTLRDALHQLESLGYVGITRGRSGGVRVHSTWGPESGSHIRSMLLPRWQHLTWLFDLTRSLLPMIAGLAAERRTDEHIGKIWSAVEAYEKAEDRDVMRTADHTLHSAVAEATGNPYYVSIDSQLRIQLTFGTDSLPYDTEIRQRALDDHRAIAEAIEAGDSARAADLTMHHFIDLAEKPMLRLRQRVEAAGASESE